MRKAAVWSIGVVVLALGVGSAPGELIHYWNFDLATGTDGLGATVPTGVAATDVSFPDLVTGGVPLTPAGYWTTNNYNVIAGHDGVATNKAVQIIYKYWKEPNGTEHYDAGGFGSGTIKSIPTDFTYVAWVRWDGTGYNSNAGFMTNRNGPLDNYNSGSAFNVGVNGANLSGAWTRATGAWYFMTITGDKSGAQKLTASITPVGQASLGVGTGSVNFINTAYNPTSSATAAQAFSVGTASGTSQDKYTFNGYSDMAAIYNNVLTYDQLWNIYQNGVATTPHVSASPAPLGGPLVDFNWQHVTIGTPTTTTTVKLTNDGSTVVNVTGVSFGLGAGSPFALDGAYETGTPAIAKGANVTYGVRFSAPGLGTYSDTLTITTDIGMTFTYNLAASVLHMGDANGDGRVDLQDFSLLKAYYGQTGQGWDHGNFNGDANGLVNLEDFSLLKAHYNHTDGNVNVTPVPEPASLSLLALAGIGLLKRTRKS